MRKRLYCLVLGFQLVAILQGIAQSTITISGTISELGAQEALTGASVVALNQAGGAVANDYGFYALSVSPQDSITLQCSFIGYQTQTVRVAARKNILFNIALKNEAQTLSTVEVKATPQYLASETGGLSILQLSTKQIKELPALGGERDVLKVLQLLPGVQNPREGSSGLFVRGGDPGQNLFLLDEAIVYNAYHLFGFFSVFNGDALRHVELMKGSFPARYGGRTSAILNLKMREGNKEKHHGEGGIGLIASRLTLEGPIVKNKVSYLVSGRRTYIDALLPLIQAPSERTAVYFYDANAKINWAINSKNQLSLSGYIGQDFYNFYKKNDLFYFKDGMNWGNATGSLRWSSTVNSRFFSNVTLNFSRFKFNVTSEQSFKDSIASLAYFSSIKDLSLKWDTEYHPSVKHTIRSGLQTFQHHFENAAFVTRNARLNINAKSVNPTDAVESAAYIEDTYQPAENVVINGGVRLVHFNTQNRNYGRFEPRLSLSFNTKHSGTFQTAYSRMNQFLHLLSNTGAGLPTDIWVPATDRIPPQQSDQVSIGWQKSFFDKKIMVSTEGYYKWLRQNIGYRDGANFLVFNAGPNPEALKQVRIEDNIAIGNGYSYGSEWLVQYQDKKLNAWASYTLSWTKQRLEGVNNNNYFWAKQDRRHNLSLASTYNISKHWRLSAVWVFGSGTAVTLPVSQFQGAEFGQVNITPRPVYEYSSRQAYRLPNYHRLDISVQWLRTKKWGESTWEIGAYNVYNRANPLYVRPGVSPTNPRVTQLYRVSLFPIIPSLSYNFKF
jgi:hypothetical protein